MKLPLPQHRRILWAVSEAGPLSRTEIAETTGMSKATVTTAARELIAQGLLLEADTRRGAGRPSVRLALGAGTSWFAGLSLQPHRSRLVLCDALGKIVGTAQLAVVTDPAEVPPLLEKAIDDLLKATGIDRDSLHGVGISLTGVVNAAQDTCIRSTLMGWENEPLGRDAAAHLGLPVHVENDANSLAMSEKLFGAASDASSFVLIDMGDGIGGAVFVGRDLIRGHSGGAGEVAHVTVAPNGTPCQCGKRGCLDTIASLRAIRIAARQAGFVDHDFDALEREAARGNADAVAILHNAGEALGLVVAHVIQIVNPEQVLVRISAEPVDGLFATTLRQSVNANVLPQMRSRTLLDISRPPPGAHAVGAASIAAHRFLLAPDPVERFKA